MYITPLHKCADASSFGEKAAGLCRLMQSGVNVPNGFALSQYAFSTFNVEGGDLGVLSHHIQTALPSLKSPKVIVRSSALGEDSDEHSFAGQLDSFVVNNEWHEVLKGIQKCWKSLGSERTKAYQEQAGVELKTMGVIVQEFIEPQYAGVTFTRTPSGAEGFYTEYVEGHGEQLVSGAVTPFTLLDEDHNNDTAPFDIFMLKEEAKRLVESWEMDLDIEWAAAAGKIYFVQARPITTEAKSQVFWSNTNLNENYPKPISPLLYSIARTSYYHYFKNLATILQIHPESIQKLEPSFANTVGSWGHMIYYNMSSIHNILASSPLREYFVDAFNQFVGYPSQDVGHKAATKTAKGRFIANLFKLNATLEKNVQWIEENVNAFAKKADKASSQEELNQALHGFFNLRFHQWYRASLADMFSMITYKVLGVLTRKYYGEESVGVHNTLVQAIPGLMSSEPLNKTYDIAQYIQSKPELTELFLKQSPTQVWTQISNAEVASEDESVLFQKIENYLSDFGFRCSGELMFFETNYFDDPTQYIELLQGYLKQESEDPRRAIERKAGERKKATRSLLARVLKNRWYFPPLGALEALAVRWLIKRTQNAISSRERVRYMQAKMYYAFKKAVQRWGHVWAQKGWLRLAEDVFFMTYTEISELASDSYANPSQFKEVLALRKSDFALEAPQQYPENFSTLVGERPSAEELSIADDGEGQKGLAASGGTITGTIKVLESVLEGHKLNKGDILVTKQTDPGWAMVFPIIGGLIVERGGALSHGAIVAREFGIPAVVGVPGVTQNLKDGQTVKVDGDRGTVSIVKDSAA